MLVQCKRDALSLSPPFPSRKRVKTKKNVFLNCDFSTYKERRNNCNGSGWIGPSGASERG